MPKRISQKDFAAQLRARMPELKDFNDTQIVNRILELRPELKDKIENPMAGDIEASTAQQKATEKSRSTAIPASEKFFSGHPKLANIARSATGTLPGLGAMGGALLATPETLGAGTIVGGALGAGVGSGTQDLLDEALGLTPTSSPTSKIGRIGMDIGLAAIAPGVMESALHPIDTARMAASGISGIEDSIIPKGLRPFVKLPFLEDFAAGGKTTFNPLIRPPWGNTPISEMPPIQQSAEPMLNKIGQALTNPNEEDMYNLIREGYIGPERRILNPTEYTGPRSRMSDLPIENPTTNPVAAASQMLKEDPEIMAKGKAMREQASGPRVKDILEQQASTKPSVVIVKKEIATPDRIKQAKEMGFKFLGVNDLGDYRFQKVTP